MRYIFVFFLLIFLLSCKSRISPPELLVVDSLSLQKGNCPVNCEPYFLSINVKGEVQLKKYPAPAKVEISERKLNAAEIKKINVLISDARVFELQNYYNFDDLDTQPVVLSCVKDQKIKVIKFKSGAPAGLRELVKGMEKLVK